MAGNCVPDAICHWCHQNSVHTRLGLSFSCMSHPPDSFLKAVADHFPSPPVILPDWSHDLLWINNIPCISYLLLPVSYLLLYITCPPLFLAWNSNIHVLKTHGDQECTCGLVGSSALEPVMVSRYLLGCPVGSSHTDLLSVLQTCWSCCCPGPLNWLFPPQESSSSRFLYCWALGFPDGSAGKKPACQCRRHKRHEFEALTSFKALLKHHVLLAVYPGKITQSPEPLISFIFFCFSIAVLIY